MVVAVYVVAVYVVAVDGVVVDAVIVIVFVVFDCMQTNQTVACVVEKRQECTL